MMEQDGYEGRGVQVAFLVIGLLLTFVAAFLIWGFILLWNRPGYGLLAIISPLIFGGIALQFWFDIIFGRIVVDEEGIVYERCPPRVRDLLSRLHISKLVGPDIVYDFEIIKRLKVRGNLVSIWCGWLHSPGPILIQNPKGFVEVVKRYAPSLMPELKS